MNRPLVSTSLAPRRRWARRLRVALSAPLLALSAAASAAPLTYYFGGTLDLAIGNAAGYSGQAFTGRLLYDPAAPLVDAGLNFKNYAGPAAAVAFSVGGDSWTSGASTQTVFNGILSTGLLLGDGMMIAPVAGSGTGALASLDYMTLFQDIDLGVLPFMDLPAQMLTSGDPRLRRMTIQAEDLDARFNTLGGFAGTVNCFSARLGDCGSGTPVPEPGTLALVAAGLIAARRRRASS